MIARELECSIGKAAYAVRKSGYKAYDYRNGTSAFAQMVRGEMETMTAREVGKLTRKYAPFAHKEAVVPYASANRRAMVGR